MKKLLTLSVSTLLTISSAGFAGTIVTYNPAPDGKSTAIKIEHSDKITSDGSWVRSGIQNFYYWTVLADNSGTSYFCLVTLDSPAKAALYASYHNIISSRDNARGLVYTVHVDGSTDCQNISFDELSY